MPERGAALVTGGSAGIGRVICEHLLASGYEVISLDRQPGSLANARLQTIEVDLMDRAATARALREVTQKFEVLTVVHNAGVIRPALLADVKLGDLDDLVNLHLATGILLMQAVLPAMRAKRFGRAVLISSRGALGLATRTSYAATKAGMIGMARTWALEEAPNGITVNAIAPGPIRTDMFYEIVPSAQETKVAQTIPVQRLGEAEDVAHAVDFFVDPASSFVTGQVLYVCGGTSIGSLKL